MHRKRADLVSNRHVKLTPTPLIIDTYLQIGFVRRSRRISTTVISGNNEGGCATHPGLRLTWKSPSLNHLFHPFFSTAASTPKVKYCIISDCFRYYYYNSIISLLIISDCFRWDMNHQSTRMAVKNEWKWL